MNTLQVSEAWDTTYPLPEGSGGDTSGVTASDLVFVEGRGVETGAGHGDTSFVFAEGDPVANTGGSSLVFEAGSGVDFGTTTDDLLDEGTVNERWDTAYPSLGLALTTDWEGP